MSAVTQHMFMSSTAINNGMTVLSHHDHSEADCTTVAGQSPGPMSLMNIGSKQAGGMTSVTRTISKVRKPCLPIRNVKSCK